MASTLELKDRDACLVLTENMQLEIHLPVQDGNEIVCDQSFIITGLGALLSSDEHRNSLYELIHKCFDDLRVTDED